MGTRTRVRDRSIYRRVTGAAPQAFGVPRTAFPTDRPSDDVPQEQEVDDLWLTTKW
ncbi:MULTISPECIES: hypothetical protein [Streptomyces]|uniref:hypothetical protein n=1 Tax=Streptomyces TaxID=1883 RepID=UPI0013DEB7AB|nr:hypothetical protein [Streptomyces sp. S1A1-7]